MLPTVLALQRADMLSFVCLRLSYLIEIKWEEGHTVHVALWTNERKSMNERKHELTRNAGMNLVLLDSPLCSTPRLQNGILRVWDANQWEHPGTLFSHDLEPGRRIRPIGTLGRLFALPSPSRRLAGGGMDVAGKMRMWKDPPKKTHKRPIGIVNRPARNGNHFFLGWR